MKYILILLTLLSGLVFTSLIKNKTRLLEKELTNLNNDIIILSSNLAEANLDFEYLTTPKNISSLAKNFLNESFSYYEKNQIHDELVDEKNELSTSRESEKLIKLNRLDLKKIINKNFKIEKKSQIKRLSITVEENSEKNEASKNIINPKKVQKWAGIQFIKAIFGFPILPVK